MPLFWFGVVLMVLGISSTVYLVMVNVLTPKYTAQHSHAHPRERVPRWYHPRWSDHGYADLRWRWWIAATTRTYSETAEQFLVRIRRKSWIRERKAELIARRDARRAKREALSNWRWVNASVQEIREAYSCLP